MLTALLVVTRTLGEQDPRKQGLKRSQATFPPGYTGLGEQDPRKQGLKLDLSPDRHGPQELGEQDPRKQGLKPEAH